MPCWKCGDIFLTQKLLKSHISSIHGWLSVICPFCQKFEQKFKRVSDLKVHARKYHQSWVEKLPAETFSENSGFWCSIYPDDYRQLIKPSKSSETDSTIKKSPDLVFKMTYYPVLASPHQKSPVPPIQSKLPP